MIGADGAIGGYSAVVEWHDPNEHPTVKESDFGIVLGPMVVTPDDIDPTSLRCRLTAGDRQEEGTTAAFDWTAAVALAARRTVLRPGDLLAGPAVVSLTGVEVGVTFEIDGIGTLDCPLS